MLSGLVRDTHVVVFPTAVTIQLGVEAVWAGVGLCDPLGQIVADLCVGEDALHPSDIDLRASGAGGHTL